ncbi:MAG: hypothetical protein ACFFG0_23830 [Candidatus Thorarchaeota archaeon]
MYKKRNKNTFIINLRKAVQQAYKRGNIPRLNDYSEYIVDLIQENQAFRIHNQHIELHALYIELNQLTDLLSQNLRLITKLEFAK